MTQDLYIKAIGGVVGLICLAQFLPAVDNHGEPLGSNTLIQNYIGIVYVLLAGIALALAFMRPGSFAIPVLGLFITGTLLAMFFATDAFAVRAIAPDDASLMEYLEAATHEERMPPHIGTYLTWLGGIALAGVYGIWRKVGKPAS